MTIEAYGIRLGRFVNPKAVRIAFYEAARVPGLVAKHKPGEFGFPPHEYVLGTHEQLAEFHRSFDITSFSVKALEGLR